MEKEIEKLKQTYLMTQAPVELEFYGFEDVMDMVKNERNNPVYFYRLLGMTLAILALFGGFAGVTLASKPNSTLYPLKVAAQKAIANVTHTSPKHVEDTIDNILSPKKMNPTVAPVIIQSAPTPSPTGVVKKKIETENENEDRKIETKSNRQGQGTETDYKEEVKGASTVRGPEKKEDSSNSFSQHQNENHSDEHRQEQGNNSSSNSQNNSSEHEKD